MFFKTGKICLLFLSSHVFTALELDGIYLAILLWKIIKPHENKKLNPQSEKYLENINQSDIIVWCPKNNCHVHL